MYVLYFACTCTLFHGKSWFALHSTSMGILTSSAVDSSSFKKSLSFADNSICCEILDNELTALHSILLHRRSCSAFCSCCRRSGCINIHLLIIVVCWWRACSRENVMSGITQYKSMASSDQWILCNTLEGDFQFLFQLSDL